MMYYPVPKLPKLCINIPLDVSPEVYEVAIEIVLAPLVNFVKVPAGMYNIVSLVGNLKGLVPLPDNGGNVRGTH